MPTTTAGKSLRDMLARGEQKGQGMIAALAGDRYERATPGTLYALYDLDAMPPTFDIASFLFLAELERRRAGLGRIHLVIVPGRNLQPQNEAEEALPDEARQRRVDTILVPVSRLLPSCTGLTLCANRKDAARFRFAASVPVFPASATPTFPLAPDQSLINALDLSADTVFPILTAPDQERHAVRTWLDGRIGDRLPVVVSLRESPFMPARNSAVDQWIAFARRLDETRFAPVFVRDTERALEPPTNGLEAFPIFEAASWNIALRMALYEAAYVNLAVMHGAMELCWFNGACRYAAFMPVGTSPQTSPEFLGSRGFVEGQSLPFAQPWQKLIWRPQKLAEIETAFSSIVQCIEGFSSDSEKT